MTRIIKTTGLFLSLLLFTGTMLAEDMKVEDQIQAIKDQIKQQEEIQEQLRADLLSKDEEIDSLKQQLEELEAKLKQ